MQAVPRADGLDVLTRYLVRHRFPLHRFGLRQRDALCRGDFVLNWIWIILVVSAIAYGGAVGTLDAVNASIIESAKSAVNLVIGIVGVMAIYLGAMRVAFDGGLRDVLARVLAPALRRLFPEVPSDHPAMTSSTEGEPGWSWRMGQARTPSHPAPGPRSGLPASE